MSEHDERAQWVKSMKTRSEDDLNTENPSDRSMLGGIKVRIQMMVLIGRIARYLFSITALTLLLVVLTYVLGLISF